MRISRKQKIQIRKLKKSDIKILTSLYKQAYDAERYGEKWTLAQAEKLLKFYISQKTFIGLIALYDGKMCGAFLSYVKPWWDGKHLGEGEIFVVPKYQKKSVGTKLYLAMMRIAQKRGCVSHELVAYAEPATWYKKIGFQETKLKNLSGNIQKIIFYLSN